MPVLNDAVAIKYGTTDVAAVYAGAVQVWPAAVTPPVGMSYEIRGVQLVSGDPPGGISSSSTRNLFVSTIDADGIDQSATWDAIQYGDVVTITSGGDVLTLTASTAAATSVAGGRHRMGYAEAPSKDWFVARDGQVATVTITTP